MVNPYKYNKGGKLYDFLFGEDDDESDVPAEQENTAPSVEELPQQRSTEEYDMTLQLAMQSYSDPFLSRRSYQSSPHLSGNISSSDMQVVGKAAEKYNVPAEILAGIYGAETSFGANVRKSSAGATGPFQFMPGTAKQYGIDPNDMNSAAEGAAHYLKDLYGKFGSWEKAVAAYNAGPGNIAKGRYPAETRNYVPKVMGYANKIKGN